MIASCVRYGCFGLLALLSAAAQACDDSVALFSCDAAKSRKFIELCAPSPLDAQSGFLLYRFGSLDKEGAEKAVELEYPADRAGSLKRFYAATYTHGGVYTQSVRFVSGNFGYTVFTRRGACKSSMPALKCATAKAAGHQSSCAARDRVFTFSSSRGSFHAIQKRPLAWRA